MPNYEIGSGLPDRPSALTDKDASLVLPLYQAVNNLARNVSSAVGAVGFSQAELADRSQIASLRAATGNRLFVRAGPTLAYAKLVHLYLAAGKISAEYADATTSAKPAVGIVNEPFGIASGQFGEVILFTGYSAGITGTNIGDLYYLSTNGDASPSRPSAVGTIIQSVGVGLGSLGFYLNISSLYIQN